MLQKARDLAAGVELLWKDSIDGVRWALLPASEATRRRERLPCAYGIQLTARLISADSQVGTLLRSSQWTDLAFHHLTAEAFRRAVRRSRNFTMPRPYAGREGSLRYCTLAAVPTRRRRRRSYSTLVKARVDFLTHHTAPCAGCIGKL